MAEEEQRAGRRTPEPGRDGQGAAHRPPGPVASTTISARTSRMARLGTRFAGERRDPRTRSQSRAYGPGRPRPPLPPGARVVVHVLAKPVGIGDPVGRAGRDEQPGVVVGIVGVAPFRVVPVEAEAPLEAASQPRQVLEPSAVGGEMAQVGLPMVIGKALQAEVGERCRRLADREAGVLARARSGHRKPLGREKPGQERAREPRSDDDDLVRSDPNYRGSLPTQRRTGLRARSGP